MNKVWNFASYNLLNLHSPAPGQEAWHCDMKRGFTKARKKDPQVKTLLEQDSIPQRIGLLAQQGVYELHQDPMKLSDQDAIKKVATILQLDQQLEIVRERVVSTLENYQNNPILLGKKILKLNRGDEGYPTPILIQEGNYLFNLFAAIDCIFEEDPQTIHILDFKTGSSDFDRRQAYIYLLAAQYLYPHKQAVASFYNLETGIWSEEITANPIKLQAVKSQLVKLAQKHQSELKNYYQNRTNFNRIFPPNPGLACRYCPFNSICQFSMMEISA